MAGKDQTKKRLQRSEQLSKKVTEKEDSTESEDEVEEYSNHNSKKEMHASPSEKLSLASDADQIADNKDVSKLKLSNQVKKQIHEDFVEKQVEEQVQNENSKLFFYIIVIIAAVVIVFLFPNANVNTILEGHSFNSKDRFLTILDQMKSSFPKQYPEYWNLLRNSGKRHLGRITKKDHSDLRPMSLLLVAFQESAGLVNCYLENVGKTYTHAAYETIDSSAFIGANSRRLLDKKIKESLQGYQKLVIIKNMQKLSFDAAQLFMTYADEHNDVHNYPQSVIFMSAVLPFPSSNDRKTDEKRVSKFFVDDTWAKQDTMDNKAALWSRVGDGIIILREELDNPCKISITN